ncbi:TonB-dependent receptor [Brevundimonas sp. NIBR11]|uniref:TonB-dependent receptor n=1 Tax=Brevundimonas sp. NIBR11 TaxID=3015999 RepID=UPI0022F07B7A|nr:TonB-dependent receptor [Brevundimonas sp. NIBR11]
MAAHAQDRPVEVSIASQPLRTAVLDFGLQAGVTIDAAGSERCGPSRGVHGRLSVDAALSRLTLGTHCTASRVGAGVWRIVRLAPTAPAATRSRPAPEPSVPTLLDEVVVTAARSDRLLLSRAPYGLSSLDGLTLERAGVTDLEGVSARVAGLTVTNLGPGRDKLFIRGMAEGPVAGQAQALIGLYLDDVRLTYDAPDPSLRLADIERVEVLRGPQGALYGAGSMGGVVQVVTRAPDLTGFYGRATAEAGRTAGGSSGQAAELMINLPLLQNRLAARLIGYDETVGGYVDDTALDLKNSGDMRRQGLRLSALWRVAQAWTLRTGILAQTIDVDDSQYATLGPNAPYERRRGLSEPSRNDLDGAWISVDGDLGWARLRASSSVQSHGLDVRYDATPSAAVFGLTGAAALDQADDLSAAVHEMRLNGDIGDRLSWSAGLFFSEYTHNRTIAVSDGQGGPPVLLQHRRDHVDEAALFGDAVYALGDNLKITAGARLFRVGVEHRSETSGAPGSFEGDDDLIGVAPRLVVEYDRGPLVFYALATEGYRGPGFNAGTVGAGARQPFRAVRSDEIVAGEVGVRFSLLDGRLRGRGAAFLDRWRDIQSDRFDERGLPFTANLGDGRNRGIEGEVEWRVGSWTLDGHAVVNDPELTHPDPGFALGSDSRLPAVADFSVQGGLAHEARLAQATVRSELRLGYVGPTDIALSPTSIAASAGYLTSQMVVDAEFGRWGVRASVDNLFNRDDDTFSFGNPFYASGDISTPQRPITGRVALTARF